MTLNKLVSEIAKLEGKKSSVSVGNIREILKIFFSLTWDISDDKLTMMLNNQWLKARKESEKKKKAMKK